MRRRTGGCCAASAHLLSLVVLMSRPASASALLPAHHTPICSAIASNPRQRLVVKAMLAGDDDPSDLALVLRELESLRDWVSEDIAAAAMQRVKEKRSLDAFISQLQDEVGQLADDIDLSLDLVEAHLDEQSSALATEQRQGLATRAEALLSELEAAAPLSFRNRAAGAVPTCKSPFLPSSARVIVCGASGSAFGAGLIESLDAMGCDVVQGPETAPAAFADPSLPPSSLLKRELADADAILLLCAGAVAGGVSPTFMAAVSKVLPTSLRRVLVVAPRGCDRTFELAFAVPNALGGLDRQRDAEQRIAAAAKTAGAVSTILRVRVEGGGDGVEGSDGGGGGGGGSRAAAGLEIAPGDALYGSVKPTVAARAVRESLRRAEVHDVSFSVGAGASGDWDDEFLKLKGPEVARLAAPDGLANVSPEWLRDWARRLLTSRRGVMLSSITVIDLPTSSDAAAAKTLGGVRALGVGARIRFLASGVEFVDDDEEERVKGDFDGALDLLVEDGRVRLVRSEMEPVWRRLSNGARRQVAPLVKVGSEARLLEALREDLAASRWGSRPY